MLCYDQSVPNIGPMEGTRSQSVPNFGPMQLVPDFGPMQSVLDFDPMQLVPDFGPMQSVPDFGPMQSVPDFGPMQLVPDFDPMQWARPSMCFICYCVVCGSLGELTKLRAYGFSFWFQVLPQVKGRARDDGIAHTTASVLSWEMISYLRHVLIQS